MVYRWLNFHLPYRCRHSGVCCSSGWPIHVEPDRIAGIERAVADGQAHPLVTPWMEYGVLGVTGERQCTFHGERCGVYASRPWSCVHFPYVCVIDSRGVSISLSHYCPTAASLLFEHDGPIEIVEGPAPVAGLEIPEGLDARESLPPRATPTRLMSYEELSKWEGERIAAIVTDEWGDFAPVVKRYLAAKLFASWAVYQHDDGMAAAMALVDRAESLLKHHIAGRSLDAALLKGAIRQADFELIHKVV